MRYYLLIQCTTVTMMIKLGPYSSPNERNNALHEMINDQPKSKYYLADVYKDGQLIVNGPIVVLLKQKKA